MMVCTLIRTHAYWFGKIRNRNRYAAVDLTITRRSFGSVFFSFRGWKKEQDYDIVIKSQVNQEEEQMLLNNVEQDLKTRLEKEGTTQKELAGQIGVSLPYVNRITRGRERLVNKTFLKMMEELGYDVELTYKKKSAD